MARLTAEDIVDLSRWSFIQFRDARAAETAMERYRRYVAKQRGQRSAGLVPRDDIGITHEDDEPRAA